MEIHGIVCLSCGKPLANKTEPYNNLLLQGFSKGEALDKLGIRRTCCRRDMLTPYQVPISPQDDIYAIDHINFMKNIQSIKEKGVEIQNVQPLIENQETQTSVLENPLDFLVNKDIEDEDILFIEDDQEIEIEMDEENTQEIENLVSNEFENFGIRRKSIFNTTYKLEIIDGKPVKTYRAF